MDILILAVIELAISSIFFWILFFLRKRNVERNIGWIIIALMVFVLDRIGRYLGYDQVTSGLADTLFMIILIPGYYIIYKKFNSKKNSDSSNSHHDD